MNALNSSHSQAAEKIQHRRETFGLIANYAQHFNDFFGFRENPFNNTPDPNFFYESKNHQEVLTSLTFGVLERKGFVVVTGEIGAGKTTLCRQFLRQLPPEVKTAVILNPTLSSTHLLASVVQDFGIECRGRTKKHYFDALNLFLLEGLEKKQNACLIIDEVQCLKPKALEEIRLLSNLETHNQKLLQIILIGQPELRQILSAPGLTQLRQRINVFCHLKGLDLEETRSYINHRLGYAQEKGRRVHFQEEVIEKIYLMSRGIPRLINALADKILMSAYLHHTHNITLEAARDGFEEMNFICMPAVEGGVTR